MTQAYAYSNPSRKGQALLTRLDKLLQFESTIEERFLRVLDFAADVRSVERAETTTIYAPDGTSHTYTPDFLVTLEDQRVLCVECKPAGLLMSLLRDDQHNWEARAIRLDQLGQKLYVVTEKDLPDVLVQQAISFGAFYSVPANPKIKEATLAFLNERRALPLSVLRTHVQVMTGCSSAALDGTLFAIVARHELVTDLTSPVPDCLIDIAGRSIPLPMTPIGKPLRSLLVELPHSLGLEKSGQTEIRFEQRMEQRFLKKSRGERFLRLFSLYPDPNVPLTKRLITELIEQSKISDRTIFRFRESLLEAGAPGITFAELVPYLTEGCAS